MPVSPCITDVHKEDNSVDHVLTIKWFDIWVGIPNFFQNLHGKVKKAATVKRIVFHTCISENLYSLNNSSFLYNYNILRDFKNAYTKIFDF